MHSLSLAEVHLHVVDVHTRLPFRYGIARMTEAEHVIVRVRLSDTEQWGTSAESLVPKWFTKDPSSTLQDDLVAMKLCIQHAATIALQVAGSSPFDWWQELHRRQAAWGAGLGLPGLLSGLGTSLLERAMLDAYFRATGTTFGEALREGDLGVELGALHPELAGSAPADHLPPTPARSIRIRHTVGLEDQISGVRDIGDGLPVTVEQAMDAYGIDHLKVKTRGELASDVARLSQIRRLGEDRGRPLRLTVDGNESFHDPAAFARWWDEIAQHPDLAEFLEESLIAIEQPLHRDIALDPAVAGFAAGLTGSPPVIIDESDAEPSSVRTALELGYAGGTYKGCKGVFRGVANACLIAARGSDRTTILTAEDLSTLPPFALLQDFAVAATIGIPHIERNGHHYFGTAAPVAPDVHVRLQRQHGDLFELSEGRSRLTITDGAVQLGSVVAAPFGLEPPLDVSAAHSLATTTAPPSEMSALS